ncbi:hypothetical protein ACMYR3_08335 [Ampullimonas aquatilis]|uniref:hypothetical protein n=1 Tax=Ampullimonas aquatilis TaxID=1341549 RepID=UPI003C759EED
MFPLPIQQELWTLSAGTVIRVSHGLYNHVALIGDQFIMGERSVLAFSAQAGGFVEQPYSAFAAGRAVTSDGYPSGLPSQVVMQRARLKQGQAYSWMDFNCEHFVRYAHGLPVESPQLRQWAFLAGALGLVTLATARG